MPESRYERGMAVRRDVLGDAHVDRATSAVTEFDQRFQAMITEMAWGTVWADETLDRETRSLITIAILAALGREEELILHLRASQNVGVPVEKIADVLHHVAIYAGVPAANHAFRLAKAELGITTKTGADTETGSEPETGVASMTESELKTTIGEIVRGDREVFPPYLYSAYRSTVLRSPGKPLVDIPLTITEQTGPGPVLSAITPEDSDLTTNAGTGGEALGQRIIVTGTVYDASGEPVPGTLIEIWQANAAGRYLHRNDNWPAPLDPNFLGIGRCLTDERGHYRFLSVRPGAYPWKNHKNAWRPAHIHLSLFGPTTGSRLITQFYFPDDPLHELDPILQAVPDEVQPRLIAQYDHNVTTEEWALGYRFDIMLGGSHQTPFEP